MRSEELVQRIESFFGVESFSVEEDGVRTWHSVVWFATPTGIPVFGITIFSGDGIDWRVGGTQGMSGKAMRQLSQLHEVTCVQAERKTEDGEEAQCATGEVPDV